jgi:hypothetical protein
MATEAAASKVTAIMPTPWDRITDEAYKSWLLETPMTADEYSEASLVDRRTLKTQFEQQQQQNGELRCCSRIFLSSIGCCFEYKNMPYSCIESQSHSRSVRNCSLQS